MSHVKYAKPLFSHLPIQAHLLTFFSFALHENSRDLHAHTRPREKEDNVFDGKLDNFPEPRLSSLWKLVRLLYNILHVIRTD